MSTKRKLLSEGFDRLRISQPAAFEVENSEHSESSESEDLRELRSGTRHRRLPKETVTNPVTISMSTPTNTATTSTGAGAGPQLAQGASKKPLKVLSTNIEVTPFSGKDSRQTARKFIVRCENMMSQACITDPEDKISFIMSKLELNSLAHTMMDCSAFSVPIEENNYDEFRTHFLQVFSAAGRGHVTQGMNVVCERLYKASATQDHMEAQVTATESAVDLVRLQKENGWVQQDSVRVSDLLSFLEVFLYMLALKDQERQSTIALEFKCGDRLHDFAQRLKIKLQENASHARYTASVVATTQPASPGQDSAAESYAAAVTNNPTPLTCHYCNRTGHTANRCFAKHKDRKKMKKVAPPSHNSQSSTSKAKGDAAVRPRRTTVADRPTSSNNTSGNVTSKCCSVHNSSTHSTDECHAVKALRARVQSQPRSVSGTQSGEDPRPVLTKPG